MAEHPYRYRCMIPLGSCADVSEWCAKNLKGRHRRRHRHGFRGINGHLIPVVYLDDDADLKALQESWDVDVYEQ